MTNGSTTNLRILKSTWGISIRLTARISDIDLVSCPYLVKDRIGLTINLPGIKITEEEILMFIGGLRWISNQIKDKISGDKSVVIEIVKVEFAETDFQSEGLYYAIAKWASEYFHFTLPDYEVHFDKNENRYNFPDIKLTVGN